MLKLKHKLLWPQGKKSILNIAGLEVQNQIFAKLLDFKELAFLWQLLIAASLGGSSVSLCPTLRKGHRQGLGAQPLSPVPSAPVGRSSWLHNCQPTLRSKRKARWEKYHPLLMAQRWHALFSCTSFTTQTSRKHRSHHTYHRIWKLADTILMVFCAWHSTPS